MEPITTFIKEIAKTWACSYDNSGNVDVDDTILRLITEVSEFASDAFMPELFPIVEAVCTYGKVCNDAEKVRQAMETLHDLMKLQDTFNTYSLALSVLELAHDNQSASISKELTKQKEVENEDNRSNRQSGEDH